MLLIAAGRAPHCVPKCDAYATGMPYQFRQDGHDGPTRYLSQRKAYLLRVR